MKQYFYSNGKEQLGPFNLDELKGKINRNTLVWCEEMEEWQKAIVIEELKFLFASTPPPIKKIAPPPLTEPTENNTSSIRSEIKSKNNTTTTNLIIIISIVVVVFILVIKYFNWKNSNNSSGSYNSGSNSYNEQPKQKTEAELKADLKLTEESDPTKYLSTTGTWRVNFLNETVIEGSITSTATIATFKDVKIKVEFRTQTKTVLSTNYFTVYEYIKPGRKVDFKQKMTTYFKNCKALSWEVESAVSVN